MNKVKMLLLGSFVSGLLLSACHMQKGSSGHSAGTTRQDKHYWKYHGK